jgi:hypothetical protein
MEDIFNEQLTQFFGRYCTVRPAAALYYLHSKACFPGVQQIHAPTAEISI